MSQPEVLIQSDWRHPSPTRPVTLRTHDMEMDGMAHWDDHEILCKQVVPSTSMLVSQRVNLSLTIIGIILLLDHTHVLKLR